MRKPKAKTARKSVSTVVHVATENGVSQFASRYGCDFVSQSKDGFYFHSPDRRMTSPAIPVSAGFLLQLTAQYRAVMLETIPLQIHVTAYNLV